MDVGTPSGALRVSEIFLHDPTRKFQFLTQCRVLSLSDCIHSLYPLNQAWIDYVGRNQTELYIGTWQLLGVVFIQNIY